MTSFAFILGVVPLILATGAGAEMRRTLGTAVFSGMLGVTLFGIFLTPVFFYAVDWLSETRLFAAPWMRWLGRAALEAVTLRPVRRVGGTVVRRVRSVTRGRLVRPERRRPSELSEVRDGKDQELIHDPRDGDV